MTFLHSISQVSGTGFWWDLSALLPLRDESCNNNFSLKRNEEQRVIYIFTIILWYSRTALLHTLVSRRNAWDSACLSFFIRHFMRKYNRLDKKLMAKYNFTATCIFTASWKLKFVQTCFNYLIIKQFIMPKSYQLTLSVYVSTSFFHWAFA